MKTIILEVGGDTITVEVDGEGNGSIRSTMKDESRDSGLENPTYDAAIDGIEATILGHACAGVDIESDAYIAGIKSALDGAVNHLIG